jgi:uncharacterized membrane protein
MAAQKQARRSSRNAVSAKKKAPHGNSRSRTGLPVSTTAVAAVNGGTAKTSAGAKGATAVPVTEASPAPSLGFARWVRAHPLQLTVWLLSLFALGMSTYLTITHYDSAVPLACSAKGLINCAKVTTSPQSMVFGIFPVAVLGLAFYAFMAVINSPFGWRHNALKVGPLPEVKWIRLGAIVVGMGFVLYLIYAELIEIGNICLLCTSVHLATFLIFALLIYEATSWGLSAAGTRR